jgi:methylated-DNA-protein-cysteine methyltransferase-like protein
MSKQISNYQRIYKVVGQIPAGKVATYGQIAQLAGLPRHARMVGYALHALPHGSELPWHRVVNAKGEVSLRSTPQYEDIQRQLLEREGLAFNDKGRLSLSRCRWLADDSGQVIELDDL